MVLRAHPGLVVVQDGTTATTHLLTSSTHVLPGCVNSASIQAESCLLTIYSFQIICQILKYFPHVLQCPPNPPKPTPTTSSTPSPTPTVPADGYTQTFSNLTAAIQADDYMTYGLVDTVAGKYFIWESYIKITF